VAHPDSHAGAQNTHVWTASALMGPGRISMQIGGYRASAAIGSGPRCVTLWAIVMQLYQDHASGKKDDRPGLAACLKSLRDGDTLVVWKLDRLGRDLHHLVNTVHDLTARGVGLKVLRVTARRPAFRA
jgi:Resolvase, N terminal domain